MAECHPLKAAAVGGSNYTDCKVFPGPFRQARIVGKNIASYKILINNDLCHRTGTGRRLARDVH